MKDKVMVIRYDGKPPRQIEWDGEPVKWCINADGFPVAITCSKHAAKMASGNPNRYRLFMSKSLMAKKNMPNGQSKWIDINSWFYEIVAIKVGDDENGETITEPRINWYEDKDGKHVVEATEEFLLGKKMVKLDTDENFRLEKINRSLVKQRDEFEASLKTTKEYCEKIKDNFDEVTKDRDKLTEQVAELKAQVEELTKPKPVAPKKK